eukprot:6201945-Pleurochrysis_carterae.AAC.1
MRPRARTHASWSRRSDLSRALGISKNAASGRTTCTPPSVAAPANAYCLVNKNAEPRAIQK